MRGGPPAFPVLDEPSHIPDPRTVAVTDSVRFGPAEFVVIAGPCAVEGRDQLLATARAVAAAGAAMLRGGAFKPRTSPDSFQGLGRRGLELLREASAETGLPVVTEVMDPRDVDLVCEHAAMLQVGSRNMQNIPLLCEVGRAPMPVLLKRGASATLEELLCAAEYVHRGGNADVVLCERGLRSFDPSTRCVLDLAAVPELKSRSGLPVVVDPSHGTGRRHLVVPMARAALAAGADGILIEVHPDPREALSDGPQALTFDQFADLVREIDGWMGSSGRSRLRCGAWGEKAQAT